MRNTTIRFVFVPLLLLFTPQQLAVVVTDRHLLFRVVGACAHGWGCPVRSRAFGYGGQSQPLAMEIAPSPGGVQHSWSSWYGRRYQLQESGNLGMTPWTNIGATPITGTGLKVTIERPIDAPKNFFRLQIVD